MNTFLPYPSFDKSARILDYRRLGKQRLEARQLLNALCGKTRGWFNHPAAKMWRGYENALAVYMNAMIEEWIIRGYKNSMEFIKANNVVYPPWLGEEKFHASHRSNLLRKDPEYYGCYGWTEKPDLPYIWPGEQCSTNG